MKTTATQSPSELVKALRDAGYDAVAEGLKDVRNLIHAASGDDEQPLCSGWRVFPDGTRCQGCADCSPYDEKGKR